MPRITPALIADFIEARFPELRDRVAMGTVDQGSLQTVGILVAMLDRLEEGILSGLAAQPYRETVISTEYLRATANRWQFPPLPGRGPYTVGPYQPLENRHPIIVLRDVMRAAPDEPIAVDLPHRLTRGSHAVQFNKVHPHGPATGHVRASWPCGSNLLRSADTRPTHTPSLRHQPGSRGRPGGVVFQP
jgi:hypothetical protein